MLSHERRAKAVAYSRAGYTLYFASYFLGGLFLFLILRLGWAAKFQDIAENVSEKKWIQGLVFVPLLFLTIAVLHLPLRVYWHALSLHYEQSVQGWASWFWDWTKGEPPKTNPAYYLRFCKSFSRMGGSMQYVQCDNAAFVHNLFHRLIALTK